MIRRNTHQSGPSQPVSVPSVPSQRISLSLSHSLLSYSLLLYLISEEDYHITSLAWRSACPCLLTQMSTCQANSFCMTSLLGSVCSDDILWGLHQLHQDTLGANGECFIALGVNETHVVPSYPTTTTTITTTKTTTTKTTTKTTYQIYVALFSIDFSFLTQQAS